MRDALNDWKETLDELGVMGLAPSPTERAAPPPPKSPAPSPPARPPAAKPYLPSKPATKQLQAPMTKAEPEWEAPSDPSQNPPDIAIAECQSLEELKACMAKCAACPLAAGRIKLVFGEGSPKAKIMFVGEGPGRDEDIHGRPFVGRAGALLDKMIAAIGMQRGDVYIANIVKCRPPDNRVPNPQEAQACLRYLHRQIELISPAVIVGLGATPLRDLMGIPSGITKIRGTWQMAKIAGKEIPYMPTLHPAYVLRAYTKENRQAAWDDLKAAKERAGGG